VWCPSWLGVLNAALLGHRSTETELELRFKDADFLVNLPYPEAREGKSRAKTGRIIQTNSTSDQKGGKTVKMSQWNVFIV
jgi:hypothetical protein